MSPSFYKPLSLFFLSFFSPASSPPRAPALPLTVPLCLSAPSPSLISHHSHLLSPVLLLCRSLSLSLSSAPSCPPPPPFPLFTHPLSLIPLSMSLTCTDGHTHLCSQTALPPLENLIPRLFDMALHWSYLIILVFVRPGGSGTTAGFYRIDPTHYSTFKVTRLQAPF